MAGSRSSSIVRFFEGAFRIVIRRAVTGTQFTVPSTTHGNALDGRSIRVIAFQSLLDSPLSGKPRDERDQEQHQEDDEEDLGD